jgi:hypothetical protein
MSAISRFLQLGRPAGAGHVAGGSTAVAAALLLAAGLDPRAAAQPAIDYGNPIQAPNALDTECYGINIAGQVCGIFSRDSVQHGFVASPPYNNANNFKVIDHPGGGWTEVTSINDSGVVVGHTTVNGQGRGFIASPPYDNDSFKLIDVPDNYPPRRSGHSGSATAGSLWDTSAPAGSARSATGGRSTQTPVTPTTPQRRSTGSTIWVRSSAHCQMVSQDRTALSAHTSM